MSYQIYHSERIKKMFGLNHLVDRHDAYWVCFLCCVMAAPAFGACVYNLVQVPVFFKNKLLNI